MFSLIETLFRDPLWFLEYSLYRIPAVIIALVMHECAHGYVAYRLGDPTAKSMGRLSLNPLRHLDPLGTLLMFVLGFGWAKPVPIDPRYFKRPHRDDFLVSVAGIVTNLLLFLLFTGLSVWASRALWNPAVLRQNSLHTLLGYKDGVITSILMGYGTEYTRYFANPDLLWVVRLTSQIAMVNLYIAIFNLLPIPPLDGSHLFNDIIFKGNLFVRRQVAQFGMAALLLLSFTGILSNVMTFLGDGLQAGVLSIFSLL